MGAKRRRYSHKLKKEMVEKILEGMPAARISREEKISPGLLSRWKKEYMEGRFSDIQAEITRLGKNITRLEKKVENLSKDNIIKKRFKG